MGNSFFKEMWSLDKMLSALILVWIYRIGLIIIPLGGFVCIFTADNFFAGLVGFIIGVPIAIVIWRIYIEIVFVLFGIYNKLSSIDAKTK